MGSDIILLLKQTLSSKIMIDMNEYWRESCQS